MPVHRGIANKFQRTLNHVLCYITSSYFQLSPEEEVLDNGLEVVDKYISQGALATFLLEDLKFSEAAVVTSFYAYFMHNEGLQFQVWRPDGVQGSLHTFTLVATFPFTVTQAPGLFGVSNSENKNIGWIGK